MWENVSVNKQGSSHCVQAQFLPSAHWKAPLAGVRRGGQLRFLSFPWCLGAEAAMEQDAGDISWDPFCACSLQCGTVAFPHPVPLPLITPLCLGGGKEGEVLLLLGFTGEQRGAELCQSHMHSDGHVEHRGCVLKSTPLIFGLLAQRGEMAGLFLLLERTKFIWAHHCVSECTSKGVGKV